ncbi:MAG: hypothetical protein M1457_03995 [bacterium]|nr:hypothetical protein [bacterium]
MDPTRPHARRDQFREIGALCAVLLGVVILRAWLFATGRVVLDADECYLAIQGLDILKGAPQIFYYGQNYMGCVEAYVFALFRLLIGSSTPLTVQAQATVEALVFLVTAYLFVRRFFGRQAAWATLLLLAFPPNMLAVWLGKVRGYLPWLILGNVIFYVLFDLHESPQTDRTRGKFLLLGALLGFAWWVNPLAIDYCVTVAALLVLVPRLRRALWPGDFGPAAALFVNVLALTILIVLESRTMLDARRLPLLQVVYQHRPLVLGAAALLGLLAAGLAVAWRVHPINPALLCLGFIAGSAPGLWVVWTVAELNLKQGIGPWANFFIKVKLTPFFQFPIMAGLIDLTDPTIGKPLFGLAANLFVVAVYVCAFYGALRSLRRAGAPLVGMLALMVLSLSLFWMSDNPVMGQERYLLGLYLPMFVILGLLIRELNETVRGLGVVVLCLMLAVHLAGSWRLTPREVALPSGVTAEERAILAYARDHRFDAVLIDASDDLAMRLTFFADQRTVFLNPKGYSNRIERHKRLFRERADYVLFRSEADHGENPIDQLPDDHFGHFDVYDRLPKNMVLKAYGNYFFK